MKHERPSWDLINCMIVWVISLLATCLRLQVGALVWNPRTKQILGVGYNGAPSGQPECREVGCEVVDGHCLRSLHADTNVLYWTGTQSRGCWMYINYNPCRRCVNHIIQAGIERVVFTEPYGRDQAETNEILLRAGIEVACFSKLEVIKGFLTVLAKLGYTSPRG